MDYDKYNDIKNFFALRKVRYQETSMVNICDFEILDKEIDQEDFKINLSKDFFYEEKITRDDAKKILKSSSIINLAGENIVEMALELKLAKKESVKTIQNVPFLMIFNFMGNY